jgi:hypothetical protein
MKTPTSYEEFHKICNEWLQGMDPEDDKYYWNMWNDSKLASDFSFETFFNMIAENKI